MGEEMGDARAIIDELPLQAFVETATWGLRYHEEKYGLPIRENLSPDERRKNYPGEERFKGTDESVENGENHKRYSWMYR